MDKKLCSKNKVLLVLKKIPYCFTILLFVLCFIGIWTKGIHKSVPEGVCDGKTKKKEVVSLDGLTSIFLDKNDMVYCYCEKDNALLVFDSDLEYQWTFILPQYQNGKTCIVNRNDRIVVENGLDYVLYVYFNGEFEEIILETDKRYRGMSDYVQYHSTEPTVAEGKNGDIYEIHKIWPAIIKNGEVHYKPGFFEWITMFPHPIVEFYGILFGLVLLGKLIDYLRAYNARFQEK